MSDEVDEHTAKEIAKEYADEECVGEFGEVLDTRKKEGIWIVDCRTYTFSDSYDHRVRIAVATGNVISHERKDRLD